MTSAAAAQAAAADHTEAVLAAAHRAYKAGRHLEALQLCQMVNPAMSLSIHPAIHPITAYYVSQSITADRPV